MFCLWKNEFTRKTTKKTCPLMLQIRKIFHFIMSGDNSNCFSIVSLSFYIKNWYTLSLGWSKPTITKFSQNKMNSRSKVLGPLGSWVFISHVNVFFCCCFILYQWVYIRQTINTNNLLKVKNIQDLNSLNMNLKLT